MAPRLEVVSAPNEWEKPPPTKREGERAAAYRAFFEELVAEFKRQHPGVTNARVNSGVGWFTVPSGRSGFVFGWNFDRGDRFRVELRIDRGDKELDKRSFDALMGAKDEIEAEAERELTWERLDSRDRCRISADAPGAITQPASELADIRTFALETMPKLRAAFMPRIAELE